MQFNKIISLIKYDELLLFIDSKNVHQEKIINLLKKNNNKYKVVAKNTVFINENDNKFIFLQSFIYFLVFFLNSRAKKIVFVAQPFYGILYTFLNKFALAPYDCHYGLPNTNFIKLFLERFVLKKISTIIHRDLRLWKIYKRIIKQKNNILIPDHLSTTLNHSNIEKDYTNITAVVLGWIDEKEVRVTATVLKLLELGVKIEFYISKKCQFEISNLSQEIKKNYSSQVRFNKFKNHKQTIDEISKFHIGICPHSKKNSLIHKDYRQYCGSSRVIDYIEAGLSILISKTAFFQKFIVRSHNIQIIDIFEVEKLKKIEDLILLLKKRDIKILKSKKIFDNEQLSEKLKKFIFL